jgi:hypothetical protein
MKATKRVWEKVLEGDAQSYVPAILLAEKEIRYTLNTRIDWPQS